MFSFDSKSPTFSFEKANIELAPGKVYDLPKKHNCRNCGAPVYRYKCEYCGTHY